MHHIYLIAVQVREIFDINWQREGEALIAVLESSLGVSDPWLASLSIENSNAVLDSILGIWRQLHTHDAHSDPMELFSVEDFSFLT